MDRPTSPASAARSRLILRLMRLLGADMPGWKLAEALERELRPTGQGDVGPEFPPAWPDAAEGLVARVLADLR